jgi:hypothetical protein
MAKEIADAHAKIADLRKEMKQRDHNARLEVDANFSELKMQNTRLQSRMQAEFPGVEEFKQFKDFTAERSKKLKIALQQRSVDMQRGVDERLSTELDKVMKWKEVFSQTTLDRMKSVEELVRSFNEDLTYLRGGVDEHVHMLEERIGENQQWSQKKFSESSAEMKKMMTKTHEVAAEQRKHTDALEADTRRMNEMQDEMNVNKESAFAQFMELQMAIEQIHEVDAEQNAKLEQLNDIDVALEARLDVHDQKLDSHQERLDVHDTTLAELHATDNEIKEDVKQLRDVELFTTNNQLSLTMERTEKDFKEIKEVKLVNISSFCERMNVHLAEVSHEVKIFPEQIEDLKKDTASIWSNIKEHQKQTGKGDEVTNSILNRVAEVEDKCGGIRLLKDKTISLTDDIVNLKKETELHIEELKKGDHIMKKVTDGHGTLERKLSQHISTVKDDVHSHFDTKFEEVHEQVKSVAEKTESVVKKVLQDSAMQQTTKKGRRQSINGVEMPMGGGGGGGDARRSSCVGMSVEDIQEHEEEIAHNVADVMLEFEELCNTRTYVTEIPSDMREAMTGLSQEMAEFIASKADQLAINKFIKASAEDVLYTDEEIEASRVNILHRWMQQVQGIVDSEAKRKTNVIRGAAREKILKKMSDAIDMAMSKHDQVLITGHSRLGKVQMPSCIACDRPLAAKKRFRNMQGKEDQVERVAQQPLHGGGKSLKLPNYRELDHQPEISMMEGMRPETAGQTREYANTGELVRRPGTAGAGETNRPIFGSGPGGTQANKFVYRGGFKMPKGGGVSGLVVNGMMASDSLPSLGHQGGGHVF